MSEPEVRREGEEFVVAFDGDEEQRLDMTSVMHRADAIAYRRFLNRETQPADAEQDRHEAAVELARERRDATS